ncbi:MAG: hypothetical protein PHH77_10175 [Victivallaceae bacterium]|nr:hypothetical protein [Victivallaceae bacterium]
MTLNRLPLYFLSGKTSVGSGSVKNNMKKNEKRRMQRLGDPTAENVGRSSPMSESIARLAALGQYRSRKAIFSKKERSGFLKMLSVRAGFELITLLYRHFLVKAQNRHKAAPYSRCLYDFGR